MPNVSFVLPDVQAMLPKWRKIADCLEGDTAIKAAGDTYLPRPNPSDTSEKNQERFEQYLRRAVFYGVTKRTHAGMVGQAFQKTPLIELPGLLEQLGDDVDGAGVSIIQQAHKAFGDVLAFGRCGMLTDYPQTDAPASRRDQTGGQLRPSIVLYRPWDVINYRLRTVGAVKKLSMVVLREPFQVGDDGFEPEIETQWRHLFLDDAGVYTVNIWRAVGESRQIEVAQTFTPRDSSGNVMTEIPFTFVGAENNDTSIDDPPEYDIADLNVAHYRNSADYEESCFMVGQPTPVFAGLTEHWVKEVLRGTVALGSRGGISLPAGGSAILLQAAPNGMVKEAMDSKERQMVSLGARLIEQRAVQRTLGEARLEYASEISVLGLCAANVANAYAKHLAWAGAFAGTDEASTFEMYPEAELGKMTPQERERLVAEWQAKAITFTEMRNALKAGGIATLDDEAAKAEIEATVDYSPGVLPSMPVVAEVAETQSQP